MGDAWAIVCATPDLLAALPAMAGLSAAAQLTKAFELDRDQAEMDPDQRTFSQATCYP